MMAPPAAYEKRPETITENFTVNRNNPRASVTEGRQCWLWVVRLPKTAIGIGRIVYLVGRLGVLFLYMGEWLQDARTDISSVYPQFLITVSLPK